MRTVAVFVLLFHLTMLDRQCSAMPGSAASPGLVAHAPKLRMRMSIPNQQASSWLPEPLPDKAVEAIASCAEPAPNVKALPKQYQSTVTLLSKDAYAKEQGYRFPKLLRGNADRKMLALTFDDGPHRMYTLKLLQALQELHAPATFFVVGKQVERFPTLVQLEVIEGNEVGNHTYDHVNLTKISPARVDYELDHCSSAIQNAIGTSSRLFRPPGGDYNATVIREATARGLVTTLWTSDPGDYAKPGTDVILERCLNRLSPGAIYLLHDGMPETIAMLPTFVAEARRRGYQFVTLSQLISGK